MLVGLTVRDIVLIDHLYLQFSHGLWVLTGETGAGKSILLDALNLAMGARGDIGLVRRGARQGSVVAEFILPHDHPAMAMVEDQGLGGEDSLILRRTLGEDGRSRAFVNDQPVSVSFLRRLGDCLVELHGRQSDRGLLNPSGHRALLDTFGGNNAIAEKCREAHVALGLAVQARELAERELAAGRKEEDYLSYVVAELDEMEPREGEEAELAESRALMMHGGKLSEELGHALNQLADDSGVEARMRGALRRLERTADRIEGAASRLGDALAALGRASAEAAEAVAALEAAERSLNFEPGKLEAVEDRLFALRAAARKHQCQPDDLAVLHQEYAKKLAALDQGDDRTAALREAEGLARGKFAGLAKKLNAARVKAAAKLDRVVAKELKPLKLDRATFHTRLETLAPEKWTAGGAEKVEFQVATNPGADLGPMTRIASGGELSRFMLALKVALAGQGTASTLVFDEVDSGIGGAVAAAVGERLARLAEGCQVLVVTHSPQVAARAGHHWRVEKLDRVTSGDGAGGADEAAGAKELPGVVTRVTRLAPVERREEIARMLSGASTTDEARAAADKLLQAGA